MVNYRATGHVTDGSRVQDHRSPGLLTNMTSTLSLLHFNDVYRVTPQKISSHPLETIDVTQFTALLHDLRDQWALRDDGNRDGLVLFSGDVFSPSIESSVTRGSHMVIFAVHYSNKGFDHGLCK